MISKKEKRKREKGISNENVEEFKVVYSNKKNHPTP
jgi:hypothetical protein